MTEMSGDGGLREAIARAIADEITDAAVDYWPETEPWADRILALPEVAALRAKAAAADLLAARVLRLADEMDRAGSSPVNWYVDRLRRTLNGLPC